MTELKSLQEQVGRLIQRAEQAEAQCKRMKDLHRSILWFVEEHKKINNCKKWMPLIEEKAKAALEDKP